MYTSLTIPQEINHAKCRALDKSTIQRFNESTNQRFDGKQFTDVPASLRSCFPATVYHRFPIKLYHRITVSLDRCITRSYHRMPKERYGFSMHRRTPVSLYYESLFHCIAVSLDRITGCRRNGTGFRCIAEPLFR